MSMKKSIREKNRMEELLSKLMPYILNKAAKILNCDLDLIRNSRRISKSIKEDRDLLVYLLRKTCMPTNEGIGRIFGMTHSAVSRILSSMRTRLQTDSDLVRKDNHIGSLFKM